MNINWNFPLSAVILQWPNSLVAGRSHLLEHLCYRVLKKKISENKGSTFQTNGKTDQLLFNLHCLGNKDTETISLMESIASNPFDFINENTFAEEKKVVLQELAEKSSLFEVLYKKFLTESLFYSQDEIDIMGKKEDLEKLTLSIMQKDFESIKKQGKLIRINNETQSSSENLKLKPSTTKLECHTSAYNIGKKNALFMGIRVSNDRLANRLKLHLIEYIIKYGPSSVNMNDWIRNQKGASYGFHSTVVTLKNESILLLFAWSDQKIERSTILEAEELLHKQSHLTIDELSKVSQRLDLDSEYYRSPSQLINFLPTYCQLYPESDINHITSGISLYQNLETLLNFDYRKMEA